MNKNWPTPASKVLQLLPQLANAIAQAFESDGENLPENLDWGKVL